MYCTAILRQAWWIYCNSFVVIQALGLGFRSKAFTFRARAVESEPKSRVDQGPFHIAIVLIKTAIIA